MTVNHALPLPLPSHTSISVLLRPHTPLPCHMRSLQPWFYVGLSTCRRSRRLGSGAAGIGLGVNPADCLPLGPGTQETIDSTTRRWKALGGASVASSKKSVASSYSPRPRPCPPSPLHELSNAVSIVSWVPGGGNPRDSRLDQYVPSPDLSRDALNLPESRPAGHGHFRNLHDRRGPKGLVRRERH